MKYGMTYEFPIGKLTIIEENNKLIAVSFDDCQNYHQLETKIIKETKKQLDEYFAGKREIFDLPIHLIGTDFQKQVYQTLMKVPFGQTVSYLDIAKMIDHPKSYRAVGHANHNNPIVIIVPCHRIIKADGTLGGYAKGIDIKKFLLGLEGIDFA